MNRSDYVDIFDYRGVSYNRAMNLYPNARKAELQALLSHVNVASGTLFCDAPAGGAFVADGLAGMPSVQASQITCVEPSLVFSTDIERHYETLNQPLDKINKADGYFGDIVSLAGLHHAQNRESIFAEWARLLTSGGQLVVADVGSGTGTATFLNTFVHQHTPQGHQGWFFDEGDFSTLMQSNDFIDVSEQLCDVPWCFSSLEAMADFCAQLFYLPSVSHTEVIDALMQMVGVREQPRDGGLPVLLNWQLRYAVARK